MGKVHGYIELPPKVVLSACKDYLSDREKKKDKSKRDFIKHEMNKKWFPAKSEQQAEARAWDLGICDYHIHGSHWEHVVKSIYKQAMSAASYNVLISISDDVHDCINDFIKEPDEE